MATDYDSPWKDVLETYFEPFMAFFFPKAYAEIDWTQSYEFLDKELAQVVRDAELGRRRVDKLVRVTLRNGDVGLVLIHVEVQSQWEAAFNERMYIYNYRLFDRYHKPVASLAVLGDEQPHWRPDRYEYELLGCRAGLHFPVVKLLDYGADWPALEANDNPFATVVMAHLKALETRNDDQSRYRWKLTLVKRLYERHYNRREVLELFRFIDWVMNLPEGLELQFVQDVIAFEGEQQMQYVTSVERFGIEKGRQEGRQEGVQIGRQEGVQIGRQAGLLEGIEVGLKLKFGATGLALLPEIREIQDVALLEAILKGLETADELEALRRIYH
jgi:hypothetical protein